MRVPVCVANSWAPALHIHNGWEICEELGAFLRELPRFGGRRAKPVGTLVKYDSPSFCEPCKSLNGRAREHETASGVFDSEETFPAGQQGTQDTHAIYLKKAPGFGLCEWPDPVGVG